MKPPRKAAPPSSPAKPVPTAKAPRARMPAKRHHAKPAANAVVANANAQKQPPSSVAVAIANVPMTVRWGDLDAFNHVNNATFLVYAQEARLAWLADIDGVWVDGTMMPVVAAAQVNFRRQLAWPAQIAVELVATRVGTSSLTIAHRIVAAEDRECVYADGDIVMVWINPANGRSVALPSAIRAACQSPLESGATTSK